MLDHIQAAPALKALNAMPAREARRTAIAFLVSEDSDLRDLLGALDDYMTAKGVCCFRRDDHDEDMFGAAERMTEAAHRLQVEAEGAE